MYAGFKQFKLDEYRGGSGRGVGDGGEVDGGGKLIRWMLAADHGCPCPAEGYHGLLPRAIGRAIMHLGSTRKMDAEAAR